MEEFAEALDDTPTVTLVSQLLHRQLTKRFGPISLDVVQKLKAASIQDLERWGERLLDAPNLQAVFH
mgnify:CR=1 FL=1